MKEHLTYQERSFLNSVVDQVCRLHGSYLYKYLTETTGWKARSFDFYHALNRKFNQLDDLQLNKVVSYFRYAGLCDFTREGAVEFNNVSSSRFDERALRKTETNFIRQLEILKIEARKSKDKVVNDSLYAYKKNYDVYGYLKHLVPERDEFLFLVRDFDPIRLPLIDDVIRLKEIKRKMMKKLIHFKKMCKKSKVNTIVLERNIFEDNEGLVELLISHGFRFDKFGSLFWKSY
ncbi:hypothetical protein [Pleionea mediterranea]|uniref:Uncharacterized protein n=1 Tax=Pleionea mediterranea TaxID=523701 RepID=A0A316FWQ7_9GAMM|nr:hypothetical protein [Pleionea mediterranea]PWK52823.1 hypothetical protein C8D97_10441 [Pleionea mediterranea]